jgi:hypothetical protein
MFMWDPNTQIGRRTFPGGPAELNQTHCWCASPSCISPFASKLSNNEFRQRQLLISKKGEA